MNYTPMHREKAIVIATGEIVTLHLKTEKDGDTTYSILEDVNREFIPDELRIIDDNWTFIEKWHPDYYHCDEVADSDDIQCCLDGEADEEKLERVKESFGNTPEQWKCAQIEIDADLLNRAVDNFYKSVYKRDRQL